MKKTIGIFLSILALLPFIGVAFFIYYKIPTTPALIVTLIILMTGVMVAYYIYLKKVKKINSENVEVPSFDFPAIEQDTINVSPEQFCSKIEKLRGDLYLYGMEDSVGDITLIDGTYNKLTDEVKLSFTQGIKILLMGVDKVSVGNQQFYINHFSTLQFIQNKVPTLYKKSGKRLSISSKKEEKTIKSKGSQAIILFEWREDFL